MKADAPGLPIDDVSARRQETPSSVPILLIPGGTEGGLGSLGGLSELLSSHPIISLDDGGAASSGQPDSGTLASRSAACVHAVDSLSVGQAVVVGHSLGGAVAVQFAIDRPHAVAGLVLLDPTPFTDLRTMRALRRSSQLLALPGKLPVVGGKLEQALSGMLSLDDAAGSAASSQERPSRLRATAAALSSLPVEGQDLKRRLRPLDLPAVVITAEREVGDPMRRAHDEIAEALGAQVLRLPGAGHQVHLTHSAEVAAVIRELIATLPARK